MIIQIISSVMAFHESLLFKVVYLNLCYHHTDFVTHYQNSQETGPYPVAEAMSI